MFRIIKAGAGIGLTENLNYIKKAENGCYTKQNPFEVNVSIPIGHYITSGLALPYPFS